MYDKIILGRELQASINKLSTEYDELKKPVITDLSLLNVIKNIIDQYLSDKEYFSSTLKPIYFFVPVAALLFSPRCFLGQPMRKGLREAMARTLAVETPSSVSHVLSTTGIWMCHNKEFRAMIDRLYTVVTEELKIN